MNGRRDEDDVLPLVNELAPLTRRLKSRVHQLPLDLPEVLEVRDRGRVGDEGDDERPSENGLAKGANRNARTGLVERGEVVGDLLPAGQMTIGARLEAEDRCRCGE